MTTSGSDGRFEILVDGEFSCRVYVGYDDPITPGYDYIPQLHSFSITSDSIAELLCELVPAASILFEGDLLIVDSARPPDSYTFTSRVTEEDLNWGNSILSYGTTRESHNQYVNVSAMHLLVPASRAVTIEVQSSTSTTHSFVIDIPQLASLGMGDVVSLPIAQYSLPYNINLTMDLIQRVATHINETASLGFYVLAEQRDLDKASAFVESAKTKFTEGLFDACYTDLREVYTKAVYLDEKVQAMAFNASSSSGLIFLILALTSSSVAHLVAQQGRDHPYFLP